MAGTWIALLHRWGPAGAPSCCHALAGDPVALCLFKSVGILHIWHPYLAVWISQTLPASCFGSLWLWGRDFFCLCTTLQQIEFNAMEILYLLFSEALLCFLRQTQMGSSISNNFCFVFPSLLSILLVLYIAYIMDTVQTKNRGSTSRCIYALWSYLALGLSCSLLVACIFSYSLIHFKNSNQNSVNTQKCNCPISCHLHWRENGKQNTSKKRQSWQKQKSWKSSSSRWWWARHCIYAYVYSRESNFICDFCRILSIESFKVHL